LGPFEGNAVGLYYATSRHKLIGTNRFCTAAQCASCAANRSVIFFDVAQRRCRNNSRNEKLLLAQIAKRQTMPTPSGHTTAILASKVRGTPVYNNEGDKIGTVEDVVLDKLSNNIMFAVLGSGGVLGMGEKFRPIPWSILDYDADKGGYIVPLTKDTLQNAPAYRMEDLTSDDGEGAIRAEAFNYYHAEQYW
jgi:sporulation protein YlmC with PRC-barrel domain